MFCIYSFNNGQPSFVCQSFNAFFGGWGRRGMVCLCLITFRLTCLFIIVAFMCNRGVRPSLPRKPQSSSEPPSVCCYCVGGEVVGSLILVSRHLVCLVVSDRRYLTVLWGRTSRLCADRKEAWCCSSACINVMVLLYPVCMSFIIQQAGNNNNNKQTFQSSL